MLLLLLAIVFSLTAGRALQVQAIDARANAATAANQLTVARDLPARRGQIYDRSGLVLAYSEETVNVIANPTMIAQNGKELEVMTQKDRDFAAAAPGKIADILVRYLGGEAKTFLPALTKANSKYSIVIKQVPTSAYLQISQDLSTQKLIGITRELNPKRVYPNGAIASNILGFVNDKGQGAGGLEYSLNKDLTGTAGREVYEGSPNGKIPLGNQVLIPATDGQSYQLTIDAELQMLAERIVGQAVQDRGAASGMAVVMNVKNGEVLAAANYPSFDSNDPGSANPDDLGNRIVGASYEPGSVEKILTFAALFDSGTATPDDTVSIGSTIKSGNAFITDSEGHGDITYYARGVFVTSSNIGTITLARKMDKSRLAAYLKSFGLGQKINVGLPGESAGYLPGPDMADYTRDSISFGMALSMTALQGAAAVAAIANGGVYNAPVLIDASIAPDGTRTQFERTQPHRVVSADAARQVIDLMEQQALSKGKLLSVPGYRVATKTGTARRIDPACGCYNGELVTSLMGVAPAEDPQILVYVVLDRTRGFGLTDAGPAWQDIMSVALPRYGVAPSTTTATLLPITP